MVAAALPARSDAVPSSMASSLSNSHHAPLAASSTASSSKSTLNEPPKDWVAARVLPNVEAILELTKSVPLLCVYFFAPWCGTCKRADPLWTHLSQQYTGSDLMFCRFDCDPEEKVCEQLFQLYWVPTWIFWKNGVKVEVIEGDWTKFRPTIERLVGPPTTNVAVDEDTQLYLEDCERRFEELAKNLVKDKASGHDVASTVPTEEDESSSSEGTSASGGASEVR